MGRFAYYSPLWLGALLVVLLNDTLRAALPPTWSETLRWLVVVGAALAAGVQSQVLMFGLQGAFAQVLPVPIGRSIRGGGAAVTGWLLVSWVVLSGVTVLLAAEAVPQAAIGLGMLSLLTLAGAIAIYVWNLPTAVADFGTPAGE